MRVNINSLSDDWEYESHDDEDRERLPNKKFKLNQPDGQVASFKNASRSKKKSRRKNQDYAKQLSKSRKARR